MERDGHGHVYQRGLVTTQDAQQRIERTAVVRLRKRKTPMFVLSLTVFTGLAVEVEAITRAEEGPCCRAARVGSGLRRQ